MKKAIFYIFLAFLSISNALQAQYLQESFGKNRIQYKKLNRQQIASQSFEFYFYKGGEAIAQRAAEIGEKELEEIAETVGYVPSSRIGIFIYNSVSDLQQSNLTLDDRDFITGGQTKFVKLRAEMPYTGSEEGLKKELRRAIATVIIDDMLYGGTFVNTVKNSLTSDMPEWFTQGIVAWMAEGYDTETDGYIRDKMALAKIKTPSFYTGREAEKIGQSIWEYIARRYGVQAVSNVLNMVRIVRSAEKSIVNSLGVPYEYFVKKWKEYYTAEAYMAIGNYVMPSEEKITGFNKKEGRYGTLVLSPDGSRYAYVVNLRGRYKVVSTEYTSKKKKIVMRGGYKSSTQRVDDAYPLLAFCRNDILGIITLRKGKTVLIESTIRGKKNIKNFPDDFDIVHAFAYSPDGNNIIISAVRNGQTDLFLLNKVSGVLEQLTNDRADDMDPVFSKDGRNIIFSSNRPDTTDTSARSAQGFRLFQKNLDTPFDAPQKISDLPDDQRMPKIAEDGTIFFLSDEKGIRNLYRSISKDSTVQVSKFQQDIRSYDIRTSSGTLLFSSLYKSKNVLYLLTDFDFEASENPRKTLSRDIIDKKMNQAAEISRNERIRKTPLAPPPKKFRNAASAENSVISFIIDPLLGFGIAPEVGVSDMTGSHRFRAGGLLVLGNFKNSSIYGEYKYLGSRIDYRLRYDRRGMLLESDNNRQQYFMNRFELQADYPFSPYVRFGIAPTYTNTRYLNLNYFDFPDITQHYIGFKTELVFDNTIVKDINIAQGTRAKVRYESNFHTKDPNLSFSSLDVYIKDYRNLHRNITLATALSYGRFFGKAKKLYMLGGMNNWAFNRFNTEGADNPLVYASQDPTVEDKSDLLFHRFVTPMRGFDYATFYGNEYLLFNAELRFPITKYIYKGPVTSNFLKNLQLIAFTDIGSAWSGPNPFFGDNEKEYIDKDFIIKYKTYNTPLLTGYGLGVRTNVFGYYMRFDIAWGAKNLIFQDKPALYWSFGYDF